jgi:hypothetical protein
MLNVYRTKKSTLSDSVLSSGADWSGQENEPLRAMNCGQNYKQMMDYQLIKKDCTRSAFSLHPSSVAVNDTTTHKFFILTANIPAF